MHLCFWYNIKLTFFIIHPTPKTITGQNNVAGELPAELASLDLRTIDLLTNKISGSIPPELYTMKNLEYLNLGYNQFTGTVASELGDLNKLSEFTSYMYYTGMFIARLSSNRSFVPFFLFPTLSPS